MVADQQNAAKTTIHIIDGIKYRVTAEFKGEVDINRTVYECALAKAIEEIKKSA